MRNKILISLTCLASLMVVANASAQQAANYNSAEEINHDLTLLWSTRTSTT
jgi:hypothetical protein